LGVLKTGDKNLFIHRGGASTPIEMEPRCVLDFYVHETAQRRGIGALLFAFFLRDENKHPARLAYDRPSEKFLAFLAKHHGLVKYQNQTNNFVVFDAYFAVKPRPASAAREAKKLVRGKRRRARRRRARQGGGGASRARRGVYAGRQKARRHYSPTRALFFFVESVVVGASRRRAKRLCATRAVFVGRERRTVS
jgi:GNAT superfamily N-acetyltransferase